MKRQIIFNDPQSVKKYVECHPHLARLLKFVEAKMEESDPDPAHDLAHFFRVAFWTLRFLDEELLIEAHKSNEYFDRDAPGDLHDLADSAVAASLLHDIVNVPSERSTASELSSKLAFEILPEYGFNSIEITVICNAIRDHSFSRGAVPNHILGICLQDADRLESLGALGIMRTISTGVKMGAQYFHPTDPFAHSRKLDDLKFSLDHFENKLLKLPALMNTALGKKEGARRAETMRFFMRELRLELCDDLL
jgi:uncharacterized protein